MTDSRVVPVKQLELRFQGIARDVRRLKQDSLDAASAMSYKGNIYVGVDWDDYLTIGIYRVGLSTWSSTTNGPSAAYSYGTLVVHEADLSVTQVYYPHQGAPGGVWTRTKWNAADWTTWAAMPLHTTLAPPSPAWVFRRGATTRSATQTRAEFDQSIKRVSGSGRLAITDTTTGTGEMDVTFSGLGTPTFNQPCGTGGFFDSGSTAYTPLQVWVQTSGRFYFVRTDTQTNGTTDTLGVSPAPGTDCSGDWLEWHFNFHVN